LRTPRWLALFALAVTSILVAIPAGASPAGVHAWPWSGYQGNAQATGLAPDGTPQPPYRVAWDAEAGIGDPSHVSGIPAPVLTDRFAIVVGRETVDAVDTSTGTLAWSVPRALGPSSPPAVDNDLLLFLEGGGDESATGAGTSSPPPTPTTAASSAASASASPTVSSGASSLVAVDIGSHERLWTVPLTDVSHTGVVVDGGVAFVGTDDGTATAIDLSGEELWSQHVGDHLVASLAVSDDRVYASVRPESRGSATLVALGSDDGSEVWRYDPGGGVLDLGAPSVARDATAGDTILVVGSDASLRAVDGSDGTQRWAAPLYSPTAGAPPAVGSDVVYVTDQSGTMYAFDRATGTERWRFATNHPAVGPPIVTSGSVVQPATDGTVSAVALDSGHEIWHAIIADSAVLILAASPGLVVASHTGTVPGLAGLVAEPGGSTEDLVSPTTGDPGALVLGWLAAAVPLTALLVLFGRAIGTRMGPASLGSTDDDAVDPWETDLEDES
jgi:outer membrane protein assembly factor BamB